MSHLLWCAEYNILAILMCGLELPSQAQLRKQEVGAIP